ncbi:MAG: hypothetical protein CW716_01170 [Candidatus Bathyarchaeum sp.]|nr:MAG: hypothetical protein CW716_01170 [Candidatus Bathyarchaeum sp.]
MIRLGKKLFICSFFLCALLATFTLNTSLVCNATPQEESTAPEKTLTLIENVVGLDMETYNTTLDLNTQDLYLDSLPQESLQYTIDSGDSKVEVICNFVNKKLQLMSLHPLNGSTPLQQHADVVSAAKAFLVNYQADSGASYLEQMTNMLDLVNANENSTHVVEDTKLEVIVTQDSTTFRWSPAANGVEVMYKWVIVNFENGSLALFMDNWELYTIDSYDIAISEEQAIDIAMDATKDYSWTVHMGEESPSVEVTEFTVDGVSETKLTFSNYPSKTESRNEDPSTLYPVWNIKLYFDKLYRGNVYGLNIAIWADTGEVNEVCTMIWMGDVSSNETITDNEITSELTSNEDNETGSNLSSIAWIALPITAVLGVTIVYSKRKNSPNKLLKITKSAASKLSRLFLCFLMIVSIVPMATQTVKADDWGITLWAVEYEIVEGEFDAASDVISTMMTYFGNRGYTCYDYSGSDTLRDNILDNASYMESNFDYVALFHYGHGGMDGVHRDYVDNDYDYEDEDPQPDYEVWDYDVYDETGSSKHFFVMLWVCRQGDHVGGLGGPNGAYGMPYAWHHTSPTSYGPDCFIGFEDASMPLTQISSHNPSVDYEFYLKRFYVRALYNGYSVYNALNTASWTWFGCSYSNCELNTGYNATWGGNTAPGCMKIYGNDDIYLY